MFRQLIQGLVRRVPSQCAVCHAWPSLPICEDCVQAFGQPLPRCGRCAVVVQTGVPYCSSCLLTPVPVDQTLAAVPYAYPWAGLIAEFKFREHTGWAHTMAVLLRSAPWVEPALEQAHCVLPMPLSPQRLLQRGFNQSLLLARALEPAKLRSDVLLRIKDTAPQSSLPRGERLRGVQGAYALEPAHAASLNGQRVVLLDDVMTTGASLFEAARVLRRAGVQHITAVVLARTE